jgi:hypothetical protein
MKNAGCQAVSVFVFFALIIIAHNSAAELTGRIIDESDNAVEGADVNLIDEQLSATTDGSGRFTMQTLSAIRGISEPDANGFSLIAAGNTLTLRINQGGQHVTLRICDMRGRTVAVPLNGILPAGIHTCRINPDATGKSSSSAHIVNIRCGAQTLTQTLTRVDGFITMSDNSGNFSKSRALSKTGALDFDTLTVSKPGHRPIRVILENLGGDIGELVITEATGYPRMVMKTGAGLRTFIYEPDPAEGYYRSCRFDYSSMIGSITYDSHRIFREWKTPHSPDDNEGGIGISEEFNINADAGTPSPPGYDEAGDGGTFVKIGVGALVKTGGSYQFYGNYQIADPGTWTVTRGIDWIQFVHELGGVNGYGYIYTRRYNFNTSENSFTIEKTLENTGTKAMLAEQYAHNFFNIDNTDICPDYSVTFGWNLSGGINGTEISGNTISISQNVTESIYGQPGGYSGGENENSIIIKNSATGGMVSITGSEPVGRCAFFATPIAICPEIFVLFNVDPQDSKTWSNTYTFGEIP